MLDHFFSLFTALLDEYQISENKQKTFLMILPPYSTMPTLTWHKEEKLDFSSPPLLGQLTPLLETAKVLVPLPTGFSDTLISINIF